MKKFLLPTLLLFSSTHVYANDNPYCSPILQQGIYDSNKTFKGINAFNLAQNIHCDKKSSRSDRNSGGGGTVGYEGFTLGGKYSASKAKSNSSEFCKMSYNTYRISGKYESEVKTVNQGIVSAWTKCIDGNKGGVSHQIIPSRSPERFIYKIMFTPDLRFKEKKVPLRSWHIKGGKCINPPKPKDFIDIDATRLLCSRKPKNSVTIVANSNYGRDLKAIELPAYEKVIEIPPTYFEKLTSYIASGGKFTITFDDNLSDKNCGIPTGSGYIGNFMAGKTYTTYYVPATTTWVTEGALQHSPNCGNHSSINDSNKLKFDPQKAEMNLWVGIFRFDEKGVVYYPATNGRVGKINKPF